MKHKVPFVLTSFVLTLLFFVLPSPIQAQRYSVKDHYNKAEYRIPMRDGTLLYTVVYSPKDKTVKYPILMTRTPYSSGPYGPGKYRRLPIELAKEGFIFVYQDVRGRFMSEGKFVNMRPYIPNKKGKEFDESSDAWDTIDWLIKHLKNNNGKAGIWGNSYPGFYAAMACIDAHPALKAASPQAPIANWFIDDDFHRHGAFVLPMFFNFYQRFGVKRDSLIQNWPKGLSYPSPDAYTFFKGLEPLSNIDKNYYHNSIAFWEEFQQHPNYDEFWQKRNTLPHYKNIKPAVMVVGGWYDSEDFYGAMNTYAAISKNSAGAKDYLVIGPWPHGWWNFGKNDHLGDIDFGSATGDYFRQDMLVPFFKF
ncbi:MAG: CocE/NonD family hydrolase, partial [Bacteroidales bacterium]|nr:CocE/NonD family hydrolase [Bacteroidales bacterium]